MVATAYSRGHKIYYSTIEVDWCYQDTGEIVNDNERDCVRCNKPPTEEGYDACLGYIEGVTSACCGHGVEKEIRM